MRLSRSELQKEKESEQQRIIVSTRLNKDTGMRVICINGTPCSKLERHKNRACVICGRTKGGRGALCRECYFRIRKRTVTLTCSFCGVEFKRSACAHEKNLRRGHIDNYCSAICSMRHHSAKNRRRCLICGEPVSKKTRKYCGQKCKSEARKKSRISEKRCPYCGKMFQPRSSRTKFCGRICASRAHSVCMIGKGNSNWRGGKTPYQLRNPFKKLRQIVMERDGFKCTVCGKRGTYKIVKWRGKNRKRLTLVVHHIDMNPENNQVENLVTICSTHHAILHKSARMPYPKLSKYAVKASKSMTSKCKTHIVSLLTAS